DYFAITSTNENGTEIDHEMAITDYALQAAGTVDELVAALESAEKRIAELEAREISLPERSSMLHRTDFHDDYQTVMAYKVSEVIAAIRAAGIRIKGE
ncbi:TPA: ead/Ea22-like family protein, partial [Escherichia coli]|nr:ead/Ea22-like family protein [Escherichia coli]